MTADSNDIQTAIRLDVSHYRHDFRSANVQTDDQISAC